MNALPAALTQLVSVGASAGLDPAEVQSEGERFAAAVAESVPGAPAEWLAAVGRPTDDFVSFFEAASSARRWRTSATDLLAHLADIGSPQREEYATALQQVQSAALGTRTPAPAVEPDSAGAAPDPQPERSLEDLLAELDGLIGLADVKREIHEQTELLRVEKLRTEAGLTKASRTRHLVFLGNPGTGKTTVARLVAGIYRALGLLSQGHLVEVDRSELVAGYLGQTAIKTAEVTARATGGVLFIDEAYALADDQFGTEAINALVKDMEDLREDLVVIVAGYPVPMAKFLATNPGLESRFATTIGFADYTDQELRTIFALAARKADFEPTEECLAAVEELAARQPRNEGFGNGRWARNMLDRAIGSHAWRLREIAAPTVDQLRTLLAEDLEEPE